MTKRVLIIGYGRAGKRHTRMAKDFGLRTTVFDPFLSASDFEGTEFKKTIDAWTTDWEFLRIFGQPDFVVIATPPDSHLDYIRFCLDFGLPVLCEKPLCALGQLDKAKALLDNPQVHRLMVAYNWRYHSKLKQSQKTFTNGLFLDCWQYRNDLPEWGLLLDHCSHDLDILRFVATDEPEIKAAYYHKGQNIQTWEITTSAGRVRESVCKVETKRIANLYYAPGRFVELDPLPEMYTDMWEAFLRGDYRPGLLEAIKTQELLEKCHQLNGDNKDDLFKSKLDQQRGGDSAAAK